MEETTKTTVSITLEVYTGEDGKRYSTSEFDSGQSAAIVLGLVSNEELLQLAMMATAYALAEKDDIEAGVGTLRELAESIRNEKKTV